VITKLNPALLGIALLAQTMQSAYAAQNATDIFAVNLEELMQIVVTSVSKKEQILAKTAAAAYVIQAEDIRRSGASNIPEALRLAPGVQVAAIGNNKWAVSIRGQADQYSNKLLVLVDGRSVYNPLFSGVQWEAQDVPLENIARIEVIRGPGASIWGANAVNGVINIITKSAFDTLGGQVALAAGSELRGYGFARYSWNPDPDTAVQLHAKAHDYGPSRPVGGGEGYDDWRNQSAGFKLERLLEGGPLKVQGGIYRSRAGDEVNLVSAPPANTLVRDTQKIAGGHLMARWENQGSEGHQESYQAYLEHSDYDHVILKELRTTFDLEYQNRRAIGANQDLIWGLGYRHSSDSIDSSPMILVSERERGSNLYSAYLQDEITLQPERWRLSLGARLEHNDYTGFELQPNVRLLWTPNEKSSAWLSLARAIRTPSRIERGGAAYVQADPLGVEPPTFTPNVVQLVSNDTDAEQLDALDLGWRYQFNPTTSLDLAAFYYRYEKLRGAALTPPTFVFPPGYLLIQTLNNNANSASGPGLEASLDWRPSPDWRLQANYSWQNLVVHTADLPGQTTSDYTGTSPTQQFSLRSSLDLTPTLRWDAWLRHVSRIKIFPISEYTTLDMRLAWQARKDLEVSLVGQNLLDSAHLEYEGNFFKYTPTELQRGFYVKANWNF